MAAPTELEWKNALISLYDRSLTDPDFRSLCLSNPAQAISEVSGIEIPAGMNIQFFDQRENYIYAFLLPPLPTENEAPGDQITDVIRWANLCTDPTTTWTTE